MRRRRRSNRSYSRRPPHVVILVQNLPVPRDVRVWAEARALAEAKYHVSVICPRGKEEPSYEIREGVHLYKYAPPRWTQGFSGLVWEAVYSWIRISGKVIRVVLKNRIDVLQACNPPDTLFLIGAALKLTGALFVFDQHDICPELYSARFGKASPAITFVLRVLERATYATANHVLSVNDSCREIALNRGKQPAQSVTVVRNGPPALQERRSPSPELKRGRRYLSCYVGMMNPQDGVDLAILSIDHYVHRLGRQDCHFAFLGDGDSLDEIKRMVTNLQLDEWVSFTGWVSRDVVTEYLASGDVGLAPEPKNSMNVLATLIKVLDYMAAGLPVVAFDLPETRVSAAESAVYVKPNDPAAYARAIATILDDPHRRQAMGVEGRARIETEMSWEHQKDIYLDVFGRLTGHPGN